MKVVVCQIGSRHRYAVPQIFEQAGMLSVFFCDACTENHLLGQVAKLLPDKIRRSLLERKTGVPAKKIYSTILPNIVIAVLKIFRGKLTADDFVFQSRIFDYRILLHGLPEADVLFTFSRTNYILVRKLKSRNVKNVVDVIISPATEQIMTKEYCRNSTWATITHGLQLSEAQLKRNLQYWKRTISMADLLLCPSQWVVDGILAIAPEASPRIRLVPYGCSIDYGEERNVPILGKVVFCGNEPVRKGLSYLAEAALILRESDPDIQIQVIGAIDEKICRDPLCRGLKFLGKMSQEEMKKQYLSADVFVLPSLSEGFAGVIAEAVTAGVPCVVTRESGSRIQHEYDGLVIESRSADAIANAVRRIVRDRVLRSRMSEACLEQREYYTFEAWKKRLIEAVKSL